MELTELKRVLNTGELPEYSGGKLGEWLDKKNSVGGTNLGAVSTGAVGVLDMAGSIGAASKFNRTADDLLRDAGTSQSNIGGVGYTVQNGLDDKQIESEVNAENTANTVGLVGKGASTGAAIGSLAGPVGGLIGGAVGAVGGLIGGLFGGGAKKREMKRQMRLAEYKRINTNSFNRSGALTTVLLNDLALTEGNQEDQVLYGAAYGKESYSAGGPSSGYNARVSNGEIIANKFTGEMFRVPGTPNNKDSKLAFIRPSDTIISNKYGLSDYVANTGDLEGGEAMQGTIMKALGKRGYKNGKQSYIQNDATRVQTPHTTFKIKRNKNFSDSQYFWNSGPMYPSGLWRLSDGSFSAIKPENGERIYFPQEVADSIIRNNIRKQEVEKFNKAIRNNEYKNGKLPGFKWGLPEWANTVGNVLPMINAAVDKYNIENEPISSPNTKKTNPYANIALKTMADMRFNNYLAYNDLWDTAYKYRNAANNNGNLSAAQRAVMNYAGYKDAMDSMAKLNTYGQEMNNKYAQAYAQMAAQLGEDQANRDQKAAMFDHEAYSAAHGARRLMASQRAADMASYLQNWTKGLTDMHMWRKTLDYYEKDLEERRKDREAKYGNPKKETARTKSIYPYKLPEVSKSIVYKNKPVVGTDINPIVGNWNRFMNDSPQYVSPFITSLFK